MRVRCPRFFILAVFAVGCAGEAPKPSNTQSSFSGPDREATADRPGVKPAAGRGTIGVSLLTLDNPFFKVIGDHITDEAAKHGYETVVVSGDKDPAKQANR